MTKEIVGRRVFFESANQIADRHVEILLFDDRCVEQQCTGVITHSSRLSRRHALKHFEANPIGDPALVGQKLGPCDVEQIVAGHSHTHGTEAILSEHPIETALVIGIDF